MARKIRAAYTTSFPGSGSGSESKKNKAVSSLCSNALRKYETKSMILSGTKVQVQRVLPLYTI